jgi:hypothetical protein
VGRITSHVTTTLFEDGLPFLDRHANVEALIEAAEGKDAMRRSGINPELCLAILLTFQNKPSEAARVVQELANRNTLPGFAGTIQVIARRLKLKIAI